VKRAVGVLTVGAFVTLVIDVVGSGGNVLSLLPGAAFLLVATLGIEWVRPGSGWPAYVHILALLALGYAVFVVSDASVGATLLLIVLVIQGTLRLPLPAAAVVVALVPLAHVGMSFSDGLREGLGLFAAAAFAAVVTELLVREQRARRELTAAHERLREYAVQAERLAAAQERNRVARDIHDGLGHALTVVQMQVKAARAVLPADTRRADAVLEKAQHHAEEALREVRRSVGALREPASPGPLPDALRALAEETSAAGVPTDVEVVGGPRTLTADAQDALYRAAQEGLTNVRKHSGASSAALTLDYSREGCVRLEVRDDGAGLAGDSASGFGLLGIEERAAHAGGRMTLTSTPGAGTTLRVEVPG